MLLLICHLFNAASLNPPMGLSTEYSAQKRPQNKPQSGKPKRDNPGGVAVLRARGDRVHPCGEEEKAAVVCNNGTGGGRTGGDAAGLDELSVKVGVVVDSQRQTILRPRTKVAESRHGSVGRGGRGETREMGVKHRRAA